MASSIPFQSRLIERQMKKLGQSATLTQYTISGQDSYGDDQFTTTETSLTVVVSYITNTREPFDRRGTPLGHYFNMHVEIFTLDSLPDNITDPVDTPPTLTTGGHVYEIMDVEDSKIGLKRMIAYRRRE